MIVHIFRSSGLSLHFIEFIEENFDSKNHRYLFFCSPPNSSDFRYNYYKIFMNKISNETKKRIIYVNSLKNYHRAIKILKESHKVFLHSFAEIWPFYFPLYYTGIKKSSWVTWGWDFYHYRFKKKYHPINVLWFLRDILLNKIPEIITPIEENYFLVKKVYNINADYKFAFYPNPVIFQMFDLNRRKDSDTENDTIKILVGNSASPNNKHLEVFEALSVFKNENIQIFSPLSYGKMEYAEKIKNTGKKIFGDEFYPLMQRLSQKKYFNFLASIDICIMNHKRAQAMGNILSLLYLGKKVYLRYGFEHQKFFTRKGVKVYDTKNISNQSFQEFIHIDEEIKQKNQEIIKKIFCEKSCVETWKKIFYGE